MSLTTTAVREAIDAVASGEVRDRIVERALERAGEAAIPEDPNRLREFVGTHLAEALDHVLGEGSSDAVVEGLRPIVERLATTMPPPPPLAMPTPLPPHHPARRRLSSVEIPAVPAPSEPPATPAPRVPPAPRPARPSRVPTLQGMPAERAADSSDDHAGPKVLFATSDPTEVADLEDALGARGGEPPEITLVADATELLDAIGTGQAKGPAPVLLLSGRAPSVTPITIAAMAPDLPDGFHVVVWGRSPEADAASQAPQGARLSWTRFDSMAPAADVATTCVELLRTSAA